MTDHAQRAPDLEHLTDLLDGAWPSGHRAMAQMIINAGYSRVVVEQPAPVGINRTETTAAGVIDWKMEAERANRLLAQCERDRASAPVERMPDPVEALRPFAAAWTSYGDKPADHTRLADNAGGAYLEACLLTFGDLRRAYEAVSVVKGDGQ